MALARTVCMPLKGQYAALEEHVARLGAKWDVQAEANSALLLQYNKGVEELRAQDQVLLQKRAELATLSEQVAAADAVEPKPQATNGGLV